MDFSRKLPIGKSLLLSTLEAYYEGKKDLFKGLAIVDLEKDNPDAWNPCPVLKFVYDAIASEISFTANAASHATAH